MSFLDQVKRAWHGVGTVSSKELVKCKVRWCATSGDKVRHAHLKGFRVCDPKQLVSDPGFWVSAYKQPRTYCKVCQGRLRAQGLGKARQSKANLSLEKK